MKGNNRLGYIVLTGTLLTFSAQADQSSFVGARATGMAGANVASVNDATAQWHNPAAFGFMGKEESSEAVGLKGLENSSVENSSADNNGLSDKDWGWNLLGIGVGYNMTGDIGSYLDTIAEIDFDNFNNFYTGDSSTDVENVKSLIAMAGALSGVAEKGNAAYVDTSVASSMRFGSFGIGIRLFNETALWVDELDTTNLGLDQNAVSFSNELSNVAIDAGFNPVGYTYANLDGAQQLAIQALGLSDDDVKFIDSQLGELLADGTLKQSDIDNAADLLASLDLTGTTSIDDNQTVIAARGFAIAEVPISYGRAIDDNLSVGITAKAMFGRVLGTRVWVFDEDNLDEAVQSVSDTESDTLAFGLDLGAMYRINNFQFGARGRNLNSPTFDGYEDSVTVNGSNVTFNVADVELDPQITLGAAFIPSERLSLEVNYDLLETGTLLNDYDIQRLSFGAEFDLWLLGLRAGAYKNLAESDEDWVVTAGLGVNLYAVRLDVGGAVSMGDNNAEIDGTEIPSQARLYAGIGFQF